MLYGTSPTETSFDCFKVIGIQSVWEEPAFRAVCIEITCGAQYPTTSVSTCHPHDDCWRISPFIGKEVKGLVERFCSHSLP